MSKKSFPCLVVNQPIGTFYLVSLRAKFLKEVCFSRAASYNNVDLSGNQRPIDDVRTEEIGRFLQTVDATIPNTIILSANYRDDDSLVVEPEERWEFNNNYLEVPEKNLKVCSIIDGQHRLEGFSNLDLDMDIPCAVFIDLPPSMQAYVFSTINFNQKKVDKSLAYQLFGYQMDESDRDLWSPDILAVKISRKFNTSGPFEKRIVIIKSEERSTGWSISSASFIEGVLSLITGNSKNDKYKISKKGVFGYSGRKSLDKNERYPLRRYYLDGNDKAVEMVIGRFFEAIEKYLWSNQQSDSIVYRTVGISSQFRFLKYILLNNLVALNSDLSFDDLLKPLSNLDFNKDKELFSARTATTKLLVDAFKFKCIRSSLSEKELANIDPAVVNFLEKS